MPIFEYHCNGCNRDFDAIVDLGEEPDKCKHCSGTDISKKFSCFATKVDNRSRSSVSSASSCSSCTSHSCSTCGI